MNTSPTNRKVLSQFDKEAFPDLIELREDDEGKQHITALFVRRNSRQLKPQQQAFAKMLEDLGHAAFVLVLGQELSIYEFERQGVYAVKPSMTTQSSQGFYNKVSELKQLEEKLLSIDPNEPTYFTVARRIHHLRAMLNTTLESVSPQKVRESDEALKRLEKLLQEGDNAKP